MESLIREGEWKMGGRIPAEPELMQMFQVSHNTIREAVQGLIHAGMLVARPGDGTYVTATDRLDAALERRLGQEADMDRILEARLAIEKAVVALAATQRTEADLQAMEDAWRRCQQRTGQGIDDDMAFHICIADAAGNPILSQIYRVIVEHLRRHAAVALTERQYDPAALALHEQLLTAMRERCAEDAQRIVERIVAFDTQELAPGGKQD